MATHWPWASYGQLEGHPGALYPGNCYCRAGGWAFLPNKGHSPPPPTPSLGVPIPGKL